MPKLPNRGGADRHGKKSPRARPDRIIEKRAKWEDYLDPDEDPGLLDEDELLEAGEKAEGVDRSVDDVKEDEAEPDDGKPGD